MFRNASCELFRCGGPRLIVLTRNYTKSSLQDVYLEGDASDSNRLHRCVKSVVPRPFLQKGGPKLKVARMVEWPVTRVLGNDHAALLEMDRYCIWSPDRDPGADRRLCPGLLRS
ncbi:protein of unknown function [Methylocaldum szegediense]|uniref:Uncharacterized protein n=1 Tax=Methylocaldum szegediense TaxID=73780 RepID=A0ABM9I0P3_9GAMM|nr:protein of unknown function [Methylocaldum szegediense]